MTFEGMECLKEVAIRQILFFIQLCRHTLKDTLWEKAASNKTPALTKSANMDIWVVGTSNQLFMRGS